MTFYSDPAFFVIALVLCMPSVILGIAGKPIRAYGFVVSIAFLAMLFMGSLQEGCAFLFAVALFSALTFWVQHLFKAKSKHAVGLYRLALALAIMPLLIAKVMALFDANLLGFMGMSYITFKAVQVLIEIRDGLIADMRFLDYLYFLFFFPVFTSGPITRSRTFIEQARAVPNKDEYLDLLAHGIMWFLKWIMYSFLFAMLFQWLMWFAPSAIGANEPLAAACGQVVQALCYGMYLFFDFAGYSLMAMGLGACLGIDVPRNFNAPFRAIDIKDFWNRWHITLSYWLRDYVFMRMSKSFLKHKTFKSRTTVACVGFIAEMALMGVWHGLTVSYVAYGLYHGLLLAACELFQKKSKFYKKHKKDRWFKVVSWAITMIAVFFGFAIFSGQVYDGLFGGM